MDDLIKTFSLPLPTHVKLDVDGIELNILQGATQAFSKVQTVLVEIGDDDIQLLEYIIGMGFKLDKKFPMGHGNNLANCIFSKRHQ